MALLLGVLFIGITFLAVNFGIGPATLEAKQTVIAQVAREVYGDGIPFYLFQGFTALLLFLAANTSFNAFPRLLAILAGDGHVPRQFALARRPPRFLLRDRGAGRPGGGLDRPLPRRDAPADPAVCRWRVHRLHHQPDRHDPPLAARAVPGLAASAVDQRLWGGLDRRPLRSSSPPSSSSTAPGWCWCSSPCWSP